MKNYGFDIQRELKEQDGTEYLGGVFSLPDLAKIPENERENYLPIGERQNLGSEKNTCVSNLWINLAETKMNYLLDKDLISKENRIWLDGNGYLIKVGDKFKFEGSDRFVALLSNTDPYSGNSLKSPLQTLHESGIIPKSMFPQIESLEEYYDKTKITQEMLNLGLEFLKRFKINYEKINEEVAGLIDDMDGTGTFAWPVIEKGVYPKNDNPFNHAIMRIRRRILVVSPLKMTIRVFDNYEETPNDWIKDLASDYKFMPYGYRLVINETPNKVKQKFSLCRAVKRLFLF